MYQRHFSRFFIQLPPFISSSLLLITCSQADHAVHQCVYRCAMHWRRVTANRVRQRGGKPRPRRATEPKSDWAVAMLPGTTRSVPSIEPSTYTMEVHRLERNTLRFFHNLLQNGVYYFVVSKVILSFSLVRNDVLDFTKD